MNQDLINTAIAIGLKAATEHTDKVMLDNAVIYVNESRKIHREDAKQVAIHEFMVEFVMAIRDHLGFNTSKIEKEYDAVIVAGRELAEEVFKDAMDKILEDTKKLIK